MEDSTTITIGPDSSEYPVVRLEPMANVRLLRIEVYTVVVFASIALASLVVLSQKAKITDSIDAKLEQGLIDRKRLEGSLKVIEDQNIRNIQDSAYLRGELENTRKSLRRLESKVQTNQNEP